MRAVKHLMPLVLAAALLAGCEDPRPVASTAAATATVVATAAATATLRATEPVAPGLPSTVKPAAAESPPPIHSPRAPVPSSPPGTPTATSTGSPTPVPGAFLGRVWEVPRATGVPHVDAVIAAMASGDARALEPFLVGVVAECGQPDVCPSGVPNPGPALSVAWIGGGKNCVGDGRLFWLVPNGAFPGPRDSWVTPSLFADALAGSPAYLRLVEERQPDEWGVRYRLAFQKAPIAPTGVWVEMSSIGIVGVVWWSGLGCVPMGSASSLIPLPPQSP